VPAHPVAATNTRAVAAVWIRETAMGEENNDEEPDQRT
jgi:hypothetical protein